MSDKCTGIMGRVFGHSYSSVVTKDAARCTPQIEAEPKTILAVIDSYRNENYHGIYCKRCGKVINA